MDTLEGLPLNSPFYIKPGIKHASLIIGFHGSSKESVEIILNIDFLTIPDLKPMKGLTTLHDTKENSKAIMKWFFDSFERWKNNKLTLDRTDSVLANFFNITSLLE